MRWACQRHQAPPQRVRSCWPSPAMQNVLADRPSSPAATAAAMRIARASTRTARRSPFCHRVMSTGGQRAAPPRRGARVSGGNGYVVSQVCPLLARLASTRSWRGSGTVAALVCCVPRKEPEGCRLSRGMRACARQRAARRPVRPPPWFSSSPPSLIRGRRLGTWRALRPAVDRNGRRRWPTLLRRRLGDGGRGTAAPARVESASILSARGAEDPRTGATDLPAVERSRRAGIAARGAWRLDRPLDPRAHASTRAATRRPAPYGPATGVRDPHAAAALQWAAWVRADRGARLLADEQAAEPWLLTPTTTSTRCVLQRRGFRLTIYIRAPWRRRDH